MELNVFMKQFAGIEDACALAQAIVDTVREPVLIFDKDLRVIAASRSFYSVFGLAPWTPKASFFASWAMANGTFRSSDCFWKRSYPNMA